MLNRITMYRLVLYVLIAFVSIGFLYSALGIVAFSPLWYLASVAFILAISLITNWVFSRTFTAPTNVESVYITALILALLITPAKGIADGVFFSLALWASIWSQASKYIFTIKRKHIFNPVAIGIAIPALFLAQSASWWIGAGAFIPFVAIGGFLIVRKIKRNDMVIAFLIAALAILGLSHFMTPLSTMATALVSSPLIFFATVMLTEPFTTPPKVIDRIIYAILVGLLFAPFIHIGSIYSTPELALLVGNIYAYLASPKEKLFLKLKEKIRLTHDTYDFVFYALNKPFLFRPGQYMEWTLPHGGGDSRGNRRYFTIASSPTEGTIRIGIKFNERGSAFKRRLFSLAPGNMIVAGQRSGEFVLPRNRKKKLVFVAGGIGITPFRSMIKYLMDNNDSRDIVLLYTNKTAADIAYKELFDAAAKRIGLNVIYTLTDEIPSDWQGEHGRISKEMVERRIPDYRERTFYISGPNALVESFEKALRHDGIPHAHIKKDFFPGFA